MAFKMPPVEVGEVVLFYPDGDKKNDPSPAVVTHIGEQALALAAIVQDTQNLNPLYGVRHVADPSLVKADVRSHGAWDYGPVHKELRELKKALSDLAELRRKG